MHEKVKVRAEAFWQLCSCFDLFCCFSVFSLSPFFSFHSFSTYFCQKCSSKMVVWPSTNLWKWMIQLYKVFSAASMVPFCFASQHSWLQVWSADQDGCAVLVCRFPVYSFFFEQQSHLKLLVMHCFTYFKLSSSFFDWEKRLKIYSFSLSLFLPLQ